MKLTLEQIHLTGPVRCLIALIALHSLALGCLMLVVPNLMLVAFGFERQDPPFFPAQSGIFLVILAVCYFASLRTPQLVLVIVISKAFAVVFLVVFAGFLGAPGSIWLAAAGDMTMLTAVLVALHYGARQAPPEAAGRRS